MASPPRHTTLQHASPPAYATVGIPEQQVPGSVGGPTAAVLPSLSHTAAPAPARAPDPATAAAMDMLTLQQTGTLKRQPKRSRSESQLEAVPLEDSAVPPHSAVPAPDMLVLVAALQQARGCSHDKTLAEQRRLAAAADSNHRRAAALVRAVQLGGDSSKDLIYAQLTVGGHARDVISAASTSPSPAACDDRRLHDTGIPPAHSADLTALAGVPMDAATRTPSFTVPYGGIPTVNADAVAAVTASGGGSREVVAEMGAETEAPVQLADWQPANPTAALLMLVLGSAGGLAGAMGDVAGSTLAGAPLAGASPTAAGVAVAEADSDAALQHGQHVVGIAPSAAAEALWDGALAEACGSRTAAARMRVAEAPHPGVAGTVCGSAGGSGFGPQLGSGVDQGDGEGAPALGYWAVDAVQADAGAGVGAACKPGHQDEAPGVVPAEAQGDGAVGGHRSDVVDWAAHAAATAIVNAGSRFPASSTGCHVPLPHSYLSQPLASLPHAVGAATAGLERRTVQPLLAPAAVTAPAALSDPRTASPGLSDTPATSIGDAEEKPMVHMGRIGRAKSTRRNPHKLCTICGTEPLRTVSSYCNRCHRVQYHLRAMFPTPPEPEADETGRARPRGLPGCVRDAIRELGTAATVDVLVARAAEILCEAHRPGAATPAAPAATAPAPALAEAPAAPVLEKPRDRRRKSNPLQCAVCFRAKPQSPTPSNVVYCGQCMRMLYHLRKVSPGRGLPDLLREVYSEVGVGVSDRKVIEQAAAKLPCAAVRVRRSGVCTVVRRDEEAAAGAAGDTSAANQAGTVGFASADAGSAGTAATSEAADGVAQRVAVAEDADALGE